MTNHIQEFNELDWLSIEDYRKIKDVDYLRVIDIISERRIAFAQILAIREKWLPLCPSDAEINKLAKK